MENTNVSFGVNLDNRARFTHINEYSSSPGFAPLGDLLFSRPIFAPGKIGISYIPVGQRKK